MTLLLNNQVSDGRHDVQMDVASDSLDDSPRCPSLRHRRASSSSSRFSLSSGPGTGVPESEYDEDLHPDDKDADVEVRSIPDTTRRTLMF